MKKKYIVMVVACILALTAVIGSTVAAPTRSADKKGNTTVDIKDLDVALAGMLVGDSKEETVTAMPGQTIEFGEENSYFVTNEEDYEAYVRVTIDKQWVGNEDKLDGKMISLNWTDDVIAADWIVFDSSDEQVILYYNKKLAKDAFTSVFLTGVSFDASMDNAYTDKTANITVTVDAVQAAVVKDAMLAEWGVLPEIDENGNITAIKE